jgi:hypothetical protein
MPDRKFPPPWTVEDNGACFMVRDANGQALAYAYYEEQPGRRTAASLLTRDEARRIAAKIAKLPNLSFAGEGQKASNGTFREKLKIVGDAEIAELGT